MDPLAQKRAVLAEAFGEAAGKALEHDPERTRIERAAWEMFAAASIADGGAETIEDEADAAARMADAMLDHWRKRWPR